MSLLHAAWLQNSALPCLALWADNWQVATPIELDRLEAPLLHPLALSEPELSNWLQQQKLLPAGTQPLELQLSLPTRSNGLPLMAGELLPKQLEWWPWRVSALVLPASLAATWLSKLPLTGGSNNCLSDELLWWSHLQRWVLSLIARGRWLPAVQTNRSGLASGRWEPLLNHESDRRRLEDLASRMPAVIHCANASEIGELACKRPSAPRLQLAEIIAVLLDSQLRSDQQTISNKIEATKLDPLLAAWQSSLHCSAADLELVEGDCQRLASATAHWRETVAGRMAPARAVLELQVPAEGSELWQLHFGLQAEADPSLRQPAAAVWAAGAGKLQLGDINVAEPAELLLEGLGRALVAFEPLGRGLETATPEQMQLAPAEAFVLVRTATARLRDVGVGVVLPASLSGGLASRLGLAIKAELPSGATGFSLGEDLEWSWELMIGGVLISLKELERLQAKRSPLVQHKGAWLELRPADLRNAEKFCALNPPLSLDDALRLSANEGENLQRLPVHHFQAGPRLQAVLEQYHQQKAPDPLPAPEGFSGQLRPYQERGLGWLAFLHRFNQGACLADDMGLGKTIQLLAFLQHLKAEKELRRPVLLVAPTSVLTNWKREASKFTPKLNLIEHYGPKRAATDAALSKSLKGIDLCLTSYALLQRDSNLLSNVDWQGVVIDEAQAIKNAASKQSQAARLLAKPSRQGRFRIALTGTPVENRVSELWALMDYLNPRVLGEEDFFKQRYKLPIERYGDTASLKDIKSRVKPFILRRLKTDKSIITDLPEKLELNEWVSLSPEQRRLYTKTVDASLEAIQRAPLGKKNGQVLALLTRLKQICNHPALALKEETVGEGFASRSAKLQRLEELLEELLEAGDRALLFTQFAEWGHLLQSHLQQRWQQEVPFLHGGSSKTARQAMVDRFQLDPRGPQLFLLSLKAGGVGLNLTRASHVFHIDRWWNPAVENQATDRAYRIGQQNKVLVHKFITTGSIEEKIDLMIKEKAKLAADIVGSGEEWLGGLEFTQLRNLVALEEN
jgi:superfamily II DNA or RNA helicase